MASESLIDDDTSSTIVKEVLDKMYKFENIQPMTQSIYNNLLIQWAAAFRDLNHKVVL